MQHLRITRQEIKFILTDEELEAAYRIMERRYLEEDIANYLSDAYNNDFIHFHYQHLEEFPEILDWLCERFDALFDANMSHNDIIELLINHLSNESQTPEFFRSLAEYTKPFCMGESMDVKVCEENCDLYYQCPTIKMSASRAKQFESLSALLTMHNHGYCSCNPKKEDPYLCPAAKYLQSTWDIKEFFYSQNSRKEAA